jgi:hypothetical protein
MQRSQTKRDSIRREARQNRIHSLMDSLESLRASLLPYSKDPRYDNSASSIGKAIGNLNAAIHELGYSDPD